MGSEPLPPLAIGSTVWRWEEYGNRAYQALTIVAENRRSWIALPKGWRTDDATIKRCGFKFPKNERRHWLLYSLLEQQQAEWRSVHLPMLLRKFDLHSLTNEQVRILASWHGIEMPPVPTDVESNNDK